MTILLYCMRNMLQKRKKYSKIWKQKLTKCTKYVNFKPIIKRQTQKVKLVPCAADITVKSEDETPTDDLFCKQ